MSLVELVDPVVRIEIEGIGWPERCFGVPLRRTVTHALREGVVCVELPTLRQWLAQRERERLITAPAEARKRVRLSDSRIRPSAGKNVDATPELIEARRRCQVAVPQSGAKSADAKVPRLAAHVAG